MTLQDLITQFTEDLERIKIMDKREELKAKIEQNQTDRGRLQDEAKSLLDELTELDKPELRFEKACECGVCDSTLTVSWNNTQKKKSLCLCIERDDKRSFMSVNAEELYHEIGQLLDAERKTK